MNIYKYEPSYCIPESLHDTASQTNKKFELL